MTFGTEPLACVRQYFFQWPEHQCERRTELVADVTEECSLGAIDLRQRFRALALLFVCASASQADGDLFGDPMDEVTIGVVERTARMDAEHHEACRFAVLAQADRQDGRFLRRERPARNGERRCALSKVHHQAILCQCSVELPDALAVAVDECRMQSAVGFRADACQTSFVFGWQILVEKCERGAGAILAEGFRADAPDFFLVSCFSHSRRYITKHLRASVFDHAFRHVQGVGQYAAHLAVVIRNRAIRKREVTLLEVVAAMEGEQLVGQGADVLALL